MTPRNSKLLLLAVIVVVAVGAGTVVVVTQQGGGSTPAAGEIFLEPASPAGADPFTPNMTTDRADRTIVRPNRDAATPTAAPAAAPTAATVVTAVVGTSPGLYGGVPDKAACNVPGLVDALTGTASRAAAFADAEAIAVADLGSYVQALTPVVLRADSRLTDHLLRNGKAVPLQAILQAGTAVLVDATGVPRVRCATGSPLLPPVAARSPRYRGTRWTRFEPARVLVVTRAPVRVTSLVVVNLDVPGYFVRPTGPAATPNQPADGPVLIDTTCQLFPNACGASLGSSTPAAGKDKGEVELSLSWHSTADLDLAVTDPAGNTISYRQPSGGGGALAADVNGACKVPTSAPVERIRWPAGAQPGSYKVTVTYFGGCPGATGPQSYELSALVGGAEVSANSATTPAPTLVGAAFRLRTVTGRSSVRREAPLKSGVLSGVGEAASASYSIPDPLSRQAPPAVYSFAAAGLANGDMLLQWVPGTPQPGQRLETAYVITVSPGGAVIRVPANQISITLPGFKPGVPYTFSLASESADGTSAAVSKSAAVPEAPEPQPVATEEPPEDSQVTLLKTCNKLYGPAPEPGQDATNPRWTLCMHDPTA